MSLHRQPILSLWTTTLVSLMLATAVLASSPASLTAAVPGTHATHEPTSEDSRRSTAPPVRSSSGDPIPFETEAELLHFLRTAQVGLVGTTDKGINRPRKVRLTRGGRTLDGILRTADLIHQRVRTPGGAMIHTLRDSFRFEAAAFEVDRMLGLGRVPPAVLRRVDGKRGSIQLWIHGVTDEQDRRKLDHKFRDHVRWVEQVGEHRLFDGLIANIDRNQTNMLIDMDAEWLWLIDHSRAFAPLNDVEGLERIRRCPRATYEVLRNTTEAELHRRLGAFLLKPERRALLKRWQVLTAHLEALVNEHGEGAVLY